MKISDNVSSGYVKPAIILATDTLVSIVCSLLSILMMRGLTGPIPGFDKYIGIYLLLSFVSSLLGFLLVKNYKVVLRHSTARNIGGVAVAVLVKEVFLVGFVILNLFHIQNGIWGMLLAILDSAITMCALVLMRVLVVVMVQSKGNSVEINLSRLSVLVYGTSDKSASLVTRLEFSPHYNVVGFIAERSEMKNLIICNKKVYFCNSADSFKDLYATLGGVDCVLFARNEDAESEHGQNLLHWCIDSGTHMLVAPKVEEFRKDKVTSANTKSMAMDMTYIPDGMNALERNVKRLIDFIVATVLIIIFSPLMLICHIAIKLEDHGPSLYKQERIGRFGRPFFILKFRSMRTDAEKAGPALYAGDEDPRLTKVGKFLRQHHLDELPQLINVFKGDMAFIGWRPERKFYIDQIMEVDPRYSFLYQIRPGVTSYATLYNGYTDTMDKMLRRLQYDLYYLKNRSWWFDIKILWLTFINIVFGKKF